MPRDRRKTLIAAGALALLAGVAGLMAMKKQEEENNQGTGEGQSITFTVEVTTEVGEG